MKKCINKDKTLYWRVVTSFLAALCSRTFNEHCLIFLQTKTSAHRLRIILGLLGLNVEELHGNLTQLQVRDNFALHVLDFGRITALLHDIFIALLCRCFRSVIFSLTLSLSCISHERRNCQREKGGVYFSYRLSHFCWANCNFPLSTRL